MSEPKAGSRPRGRGPLRKDHPNQPLPVIWFTGLPASGKSTLAGLLQGELSRRSRDSRVLDGDDLRMTVSEDLGYSRRDRRKSVLRAATVAKYLVSHGTIAIVALVSPYRAVRAEARKFVGPAFIEVFVRCSLETCAARDPKGLYRRAMSGEISGVTGLDSGYESPHVPDVVVRTDRDSPRSCVRTILAALRRKGMLATRRAVGSRRSR